MIYGAGLVGRQYIAQVMRESYCRIAYVVDIKYRELAGVNIGVPILALTALEGEHRKIVIAAQSGVVAEEMREYLRRIGIPDGNIMYDDRVCVVEMPEGFQSMRQGAYMTSYDMEKPSSTEKLRQFLEIQTLMALKKVKGFGLVRMGNANDGGYVMLDDFSGGEKTAYSFGISNDVTWDAAIADLGYKVFMYDPTISALPYESPSFFFFKIGIADTFEAVGKQYDTLAHLIEMNEHSEKKHMVLKMDVEGAEYGFLEMTASAVLKRFNQMVFEFHNVLSDPVKLLKALEKISITHELIHVHANNYGRVCYIDGMVFPDTYELTFANKDKYSFENADDVILPIAIDAPCRKEVCEIGLGRWNKRLQALNNMMDEITRREASKEKVIVYGMGKRFGDLWRWIQREFEVIGVTDSYKVPDEGFGGLYMKPSEIAEAVFDKILICSTDYYEQIYQACIGFGIPKDKILDVDDKRYLKSHQ